MFRTFVVSCLFRSRKRRNVLALLALLLMVTVMLHLGKERESPFQAENTVYTKRWNLKPSQATSNSAILTATAGIECSWKNCTRNVSAGNATFVGVSQRASDYRSSLPGSVRKDSTFSNQLSDCSWVNFTVKGPPYFLTAVFIVRIYEGDKSELTTAEVRQWLVYLRYAGVEHVYLYDLWYLPGESQREALDDYIREGYLTYTDWHKYNPYVRQKSQLPAYQHCLDNFGKESTWQAAIDIDEYPFSPDDTEPGFMNRFVKKFSEQYSDVSEITMQNFLYLGEKNKSKELLMEQLWRHTHGPSNALVKPIYKPSDIRKAQIHHNVRLYGRTRDAPTNELRINHYWGARLQNWGPDTKESLAKTEEDRGLEPIVAAFKKCEKYTQHYL